MNIDNRYDICKTIEELKFTDLGTDSITYAKYDLIDTLGVSIAGASAPGINDLLGVYTSVGGDGQSTVFAKNIKLPSIHAAMINGAMAHALDFDDTLDFAGNIHVGASLIPATLAMSDQVGGVSGKDLLTAIVAGMEVSCRLAEIAYKDVGWHRTSAFGIFGATVAVCKILGLEAELIREALGIALSLASGTRQCIVDGALTKRLQAGFAASHAVTAALYAKAGLTGALDPFWGKYGFFEMYQGGGYDKSNTLETFGQKYLMTSLSFKPYPCGRPTHKFVLAAIKACEQLSYKQLDPEDIATVMVKCNVQTYERHKLNSDPQNVPQNQIEAQFHVGFLIASSLVNGQFGLKELNSLEHGTVAKILNNFMWKPTREAFAGDKIGVLEVQTTKGEKCTVDITESSVAQCSSTVGQLVISKFESCTQYATANTKSTQVNGLIDIIGEIESMQNSLEITDRVLTVN